MSLITKIRELRGLRKTKFDRLISEVTITNYRFVLQLIVLERRYNGSLDRFYETMQNELDGEKRKLKEIQGED